MLFWVVILLIGVQRLIELRIAKRNEKKVLNQGGYEVGQRHYKYMVLLHLSFFLSLICEVTIFEKGASSIFPLLLFLFFLTQLGRIWVIYSLGMFWNTKILILPANQIRAKGPYKFMKHPNYFIVTIEFILIPLLFDAYYTATIFTLLNALVLSVRIPIEEKALQVHTEYQQNVGGRTVRLLGFMRTLKKD
ncbi:isoprenylcysteine carboxyl methyltransferase family protein [Fredinandcohnia sp. 179-A 10B2 NHS]|uniref:isoprenylcysteine carboxyl methyltransferase family protein n=1 Tax=Fredinandcohnia sp. 179-A 10B2 NHS TaxID=3235176 RepID=UPI0039A29356